VARGDQGTTAPPVDLIQLLKDGQFQLRGSPGASELLGALVPSPDLQTEAVKAESARRFEQLFIVEPVPRFLRPAPRAERLDAPCGAPRGLPLTTCLSLPPEKIAPLFISSPKRSRPHVSS
jgi:hypothetical protein